MFGEFSSFLRVFISRKMRDILVFFIFLVFILVRIVEVFLVVMEERRVNGWVREIGFGIIFFYL